MKPNTTRSLLRATSVAALLLGSAGLAHAQAPAAAPVAAPEADKKDVVTLPTFTISETQDNPYRSTQALSASRVAMAIEDIPQTISVVTGEFLKDSQAFRMLDAAKYVTPVVESTLPFGGDRYMIRGFQVSHEFVDGAEISGQDGYSMSLAPYNIERVEIIKGPNAILVPGGSPGGQFNPITKSPLMKNQGSVTLDVGQYLTNAVSTDVNYVISADKGWATRFVAAYWDSEGYVKNQFRTGYLFAPSLLWQPTADTKMILKAEFMVNRETNLGGLPLDPTVGSLNEGVIARGLAPDWSFGGDDRSDARHRATERITYELHSAIGDHLSTRLQLMANHVVREDAGGTSAAITGVGGGSRNPFTGLWEPGINWNTAAWQADTTGTVVLAGTAAPVTDPSTWVYTRNYGAVDLFYNEAHLRNDYALKFDQKHFKSTTIAGLAANFSKVQFKSYTAQARPNVPNNNLASITYPQLFYPQPTTTNGGGNRTGKQEDLQLFIYENLSFLNDRLILSGGYSKFFGQLSRVDSTGIAPANTYPTYDLTTDAKTFGIVVKVVKGLSLFYGYNTSGGTMPSSLNPGTYPPNFRAASGKQDEYGLKFNLLDGRLTGSFSYFDIQQQNYPVPNSEYYTLIAEGKIAEANALQNPLYLNLNSKGWEFEAQYAVTKNFMVMGNYTSFEMRQPVTEVRVRAVPDQAGAIYLDYHFTDGVLKNFGVNLGVDYKDEVVGENATGYTTTKPLPTGPQFVPVQPSFLVGARTLVNLGFYYKQPTWSARLQINNLTDEDYIMAAGSRTSVIIGAPLNLKASFTYTF
jgi:iron complex outermembrane receptor protein